MKLRYFANIAFIYIIITFSLAGDENLELPSLDELRRLHIEGMSGKYGSDITNSILANGRILNYKNSDTIERRFRLYKKKPNKYRAFYETKSAKKIIQLEIIFDGKNGQRIISHGGQEVYREKLEGEDLDAMRTESRIEGPFLLVLEENKEFLEVIGYEYVEGEKCILLRVDESSLLPYRNIWLSINNYQEIKFDRYINSEGNEVLEEFYFRDFKTKEGVIFPSRSDKFVDGKRIITTFVDDFDVNYGLYDSLFLIKEE